jgi:LysR family glycine cleavage system transcriptional activator
MARRLPPLNALRAFEAAGRHLSFSKAAKELNVTQAAISHQVKALEDYLGIELFQRRNKAVLLTEAGQLCLPGLRDGFDRLADAIASIRARENENVLSVTTTPSFAAKWLVPRLGKLSKAVPDLEVRIDSSTHVIDLAREQIDLAIRYGAGVYAGLQSDALMRIETYPVCSPRLLDQPHPLREPGDLRHHTLLHTEWLSSETSVTDWRMWLLAAGIDDIDWSRGPQFNDDTVAIQAAIEGQGVLLSGSPLVDTDLAAGRLVRPFSLSVAERFGYHLVYPAAALKRPRVAKFRDWILAEAGAAKD